MALYRKKPVVIEAVQWTGDNIEKVESLTKGNTRDIEFDLTEKVVRIQTLEGLMTANLNDYIIRGVKGEFYPCKPDIFEQTYEAV